MAVYLSKISTKQFACSKQKCFIWLIKSVVCIIIHIYKKILPIEQSLMEGLLGPPVVPQFRSLPFNKRQSCLSPFFWKTQYWHPSSAYNPQNSWQCLASAILSVFKSGSPRYSQSCFIIPSHVFKSSSKQLSMEICWKKYMKLHIVYGHWSYQYVSM